MSVYKELGNKLKNFISTKTEEVDDKVEAIDKHERYVNTELDYCYLQIPNEITTSEKTVIPFSKKIEGKMDINIENCSVLLKAGKTYQISTDIGMFGKRIVAHVYDITNDKIIFQLQKAGGIYTGDANDTQGTCIYVPQNDCEVQIKIDVIDGSVRILPSRSYFIVQEINRQIVIDPVEHVNESQGIEDTPVGHIIAHMGTVAPKHYLICDGAEYNIADYPYLAQYIEDNFGSISYFGGDGETTFAVPNINSTIKNYKSIIPKMNSNSQDGYEASASSEYNNGYHKAFKAFDKSSKDGGCWATNAITTGWLQIKLPKKETIKAFSLTSRSISDLSHFVNFSLVGSNDGSSWVTLISLTNEPSWGINETRIYEIPDNKVASYQYYRVNFTTTSGASYVTVGEMDFLINNCIECIKYEPTYFMNTYNTNYMQPNMYSEEERVVGCWIDGKPLYQKTISFVIPEANSTATRINVGIENVDKATKINSYIVDDKYTFDSVWSDWTTGQTLVAIYYSKLDDALYVLNQEAGHTGDKCYATIQYTKTTDEPNSFTNSMLKESFIKLDSTCTDEELQQAISDMVEEINAEEVAPEVIDELETEVTEGGQE